MAETDVSIAARYPRETRRLRFVLGVTAICLAVGLISPIITLKKFVLIENTFSVLSGAIELLREGKIVLFLVITGFSVVLPLLKIGVLGRLLSAGQPDSTRLDRYLHWMHLFGKWSMLDVFVVAVLVVAGKLGAIASVEVRYGLYAFAAAVVLTMYVTASVVRLAEAAKAPVSHS